MHIKNLPNLVVPLVPGAIVPVVPAVLLPWVQELPLKTQSAVLSALRGPDHAFCRETKKIVKSIRLVTQQNADETSDYMRLKAAVDWKELERELEYAPLHYVAHLVEALALIEDATGDLSIEEVLNWFEETFHLRSTKGTRY